MTERETRQSFGRTLSWRGQAVHQTEHSANPKLPVPASQWFREQLLLNKFQKTNLALVQREQSTDAGAREPHKLLH